MAIEVSAILRGVRLSPQKARLVADMVRGKKVDNALNILNFSPKKGAEIIKKVVESAMTGKAVRALCGKKWVPSRDPEKYPICPTCKEIFDSLPHKKESE